MFTGTSVVSHIWLAYTQTGIGRSILSGKAPDGASVLHKVAVIDLYSLADSSMKQKTHFLTL